MIGKGVINPGVTDQALRTTQASIGYHADGALAERTDIVRIPMTDLVIVGCLLGAAILLLMLALFLGRRKKLPTRS